MTNDSYPSRALRALRLGEISLRGYLANRVQHAIAPLADRLTPGQLQRVAKVLRARLRGDPVLARFVERLSHPEGQSGPPRGGQGGVR